MAKFLIVVKTTNANSFLPQPLKLDEVVMEIPNDKYENTEYVQVYHNNGGNISSFDRATFKKYSPEDKLELVKLIKNKGRYEKC